MIIKSFEYRNNAEQWFLQETEFSRLTLLLGPSGAGKSRILQALRNMQLVADGAAPDDLSWTLKFTIKADNYTWTGDFRHPDGKESLEKNGQTLFKVNGSRSALKSAEINPDYASMEEAFRNIIREDGVLKSDNEVLEDEEFAEALNKYRTLEQIQESGLAPDTKLLLTYFNLPEKFTNIKDQFIEIFSNVEEIFPDKNREMSFRERGINRVLSCRDMSTGMSRCLKLITMLHLSPPEPLILIDEFENSLGVNCLDLITEELLNSRTDIQFIITSHHPYIINNIDSRFWRIVVRNGANVSTVSAEEAGIGKSRHEAFLQLINSPIFQNGING